jgi:hypothetical protein
MEYMAIVFVSFSAGLVVMVLVESPSQRLWRIIERRTLQRSEHSKAFAKQDAVAVETGSIRNVHFPETSIQPNYAYHRVPPGSVLNNGYGAFAPEADSKRTYYSGQPRKISEPDRARDGASAPKR